MENPKLSRVVMIEKIKSGDLALFPARAVLLSNYCCTVLVVDKFYSYVLVRAMVTCDPKGGCRPKSNTTSGPSSDFHTV